MINMKNSFIKNRWKWWEKGTMFEAPISRKNMIEFARHCMIKLLQKPPINEGSFPTTTSEDLVRINKILKEYEKY